MKINIDYRPSIVFTLIFAILKVLGVLKTSWFWVFTPIWILTIEIGIVLLVYLWKKYW